MKERIGTILAVASLLSGVLTSQAAEGGIRSKIDRPATDVPGGAATDVVLRDDFSSVQWGTATDAGKSIEYSGNALRVIVYKTNFFVWSTPNDQSYRDVHMEASVLNNGTDSTSAFGFMCDQQPAKGSFYYLAMTPAGQYAIAKAQEGQNDLFLTNNDRWGSSDQIARNASSYRVGADCGNGKLALYVDGKQVAAVSDPAYASGGVGVVVWSGEKATTTDLSFDDFVMTALP